MILKSTGKYLLMLVVLCCSVWQSFAQYNTMENTRWVFGSHTGMNFATGTPALFSSMVNNTPYSFLAHESRATVCDASGQLLFYTDGSAIWNRNNILMSNANALYGTPGTFVTQSSTQGSLIVPIPDSSSLYYVFSLTNQELGYSTPGSGKLFYSVVDMQLNGGLGDVVPGRKWILFDTAFAEKMIAVQGNDCNIWLLLHARDANEFKAYEITQAGINHTPVVSAVGVTGFVLYGPTGKNSYWDAGEMKISPNRQKLAIACVGGGLVEMYDFNATTGTVSNALLLEQVANNQYYGLSFSPDNSKLYVTYNIKTPPSAFNTMLQYNLNATNIISSRTVVGSPSFTELKLAKDGKIYFVSNGTNTIGAIRSPNLTGSACQYTASVFQLGIGTSCTGGLSNEYVKPLAPDTIAGRHIDTFLCPGQANMVLQAPVGFRGYRWDNGFSNNVRTVIDTGVYWVLAIDDCHSRRDTFFVKRADTAGGFYRHDAFICKGQGSTILSAPMGFPYIMWEDNSTSATRTVTSPGTYWVESKDFCRYRVDTFVVTVSDTTAVHTATLKSLCTDAVTLEGRSGAISYLWNNNSITQSITVAAAGTYWVKSMMQCRVYTDTFHISLQSDALFTLGNDTTICGNTPFTLSISVPGATYQWQDGRADNSYTVTTSGTYKLTVTKGQCSTEDSINVQFVNVQQDLGNDTILCKDNPMPILLHPSVPDGASVLWSTGSTENTLSVTAPGTYWVSVSAGPCSDSDAIDISSDYCHCFLELPNAFTPNDDGRNDVLRPILSPGCKISNYHLLIVSRWGHVVFETTDPLAGWDGTWNGIPAEVGTYMFLLSYDENLGGNTDKIKGDITLIR